MILNSFLAWLEVCQEVPIIIISDLEYTEGSWPETLRTWIISDLIIVLDIWYPTCVPNFWIQLDWKVVKNHPVIISDLEDIEGSWLDTWRTWVLLDLIIVLDTGYLTCLPNFSILAWLEVCQEPTLSSSVNEGHWGFLTRDMEDMGHHWPHNGSWHGIPGLGAKFQHSSMIGSVSRTSHHHQ